MGWTLGQMKGVRALCLEDGWWSGGGFEVKRFQATAIFRWSQDLGVRAAC